MGRLRARIATAARDRLRTGAEAIVFIRPEALDLDTAGASDDTTIRGTVIGEEFEGPNLHLQLRHDGGAELRVSLVNKGRTGTASIGSSSCSVDPIKAVARLRRPSAEE